jgi:trk system potassium uptake protein TrkH
VPPHGVYRYKLGKKLLSSEEAIDEVGEAAIVSFLWILCLIIGIIVLFHTISPLSGYGIEDILIEVCSAQGNAGLSTGITHQGIPNPSKLMLIINMWIGRLEIIPILVMFRTLVWPKVKF